MNASEGILTARGGMTSHAALVARQMGKVCVAGCGALEIDYTTRSMNVRGKTIAEGDWISIDGSTGEVIEGDLRTIPSDVVRILVTKELTALLNADGGMSRGTMAARDGPARTRAMAWRNKIR